MSDLKLPISLDDAVMRHPFCDRYWYLKDEVDPLWEAALRESAADKQRIAELETRLAVEIEQCDKWQDRAERAESELAIARDLIERHKQEERWIPVEDSNNLNIE